MITIVELFHNPNAALTQPYPCQEWIASLTDEERVAVAVAAQLPAERLEVLGFRIGVGSRWCPVHGVWGMQL